MEKTNKGPEKKFRFGGGISVCIWVDQRESADGRKFDSRSVTLDRAYKDAEGKWQNTSRLRENDVPKAILALTKAFEYITSKEEATSD